MVTIITRAEKGDELTWEEMDANLLALKDAFNGVPQNLATLPIPYGSFLWFKGIVNDVPNENLAVVQAGDKRLIVNADNKFLFQTYTDGNWSTEGGQD